MFPLLALAKNPCWETIIVSCAPILSQNTEYLQEKLRTCFTAVFDISPINPMERNNTVQQVILWCLLKNTKGINSSPISQCTNLRFVHRIYHVQYTYVCTAGAGTESQKIRKSWIRLTVDKFVCTHRYRDILNLALLYVVKCLVDTCRIPAVVNKWVEVWSY